MYKTLFVFFAIFFLIYLNSHAQTDKGKIILVGDLSPFLRASSNTTFSTDTTVKYAALNRTILMGMEATGRFAYFIRKNLALGVLTQVGYRRLKERIELTNYRTPDALPGSNNIKNTSHIITVGPFLRYYPIDLNKLKLFADFSIGVGFAAIARKYEGLLGAVDERKAIRFADYMVGFGADYFVTEKIAIEFGINYNSNTVPSSARILMDIYSQNINGSLGAAFVIN